MEATITELTSPSASHLTPIQMKNKAKQEKEQSEIADPCQDLFCVVCCLCSFMWCILCGVCALVSDVINKRHN